MNSSRIWFSICLIITLAGFCSLGFAQEKSESRQKRVPQKKSPPSKKDQASNPTRKKKTPPAQQTVAGIPRARHNELMRFVKKHHPEIRPLLNTLRRTHPDQFKTAIQTLDREVRTLQNLETRSPERYQKWLSMWIVRSNTKLLSAQLALDKTDAEKEKIRAEIRDLIEKHIDFRSELLATDIQIAEERIQRLKSQRSKLDSNRDEVINRQFDAINRNAQRISNQRKKKQKTPIK